MASAWREFADETRNATRSLVEATTNLFDPTVRLGVTGLSRAGKTVFITALVHALTRGAHLPVFAAAKEGRIAGARLEPQPHDNLPRFDVESHVAALVDERRWPASTTEIAELRVVVEFQSTGWLGRNFGTGRLTLDIVDYPGEWLLDLALLRKSYAEWARETLALSREGARRPLAAAWHACMETLDAGAPQNEDAAREAARLFTGYLRACREERLSLSTLPPGRFLMPGRDEGSPMLAFAPLDLRRDEAGPNSMQALMERRYESYKTFLVRPFFRDHFQRLDRQIVLVDALAALNAGPSAVADLERALADILGAFRVGANVWWSSLFAPRADRVLFAATKADHLHHRNHDRLEAVLRRLTHRAIDRAAYSGAAVEVAALASVRATREATIRQGGEALPAIVGTPLAGETLGGETFDGETEVAVFPGDLPENPEDALAGRDAPSPEEAEMRFLRFRPPLVEREPNGRLALPSIRLDKALQFLLGDALA
jgi:hypothetical protein